MGTEGTGNPFHNTVFFHSGSFGIQVIHILGPVLNGGITKLCILSNEKLNTSRMEIGYIILRCGTTFDKV